MRGNFFGNGLMELFRQLVFRPCMQLQIERPQRRHPVLEHLEHLVCGHPVRGDFQCEVIRILHLFGHAVAQISQDDQIRLERRAGLL